MKKTFLILVAAVLLFACSYLDQIGSDHLLEEKISSIILSGHEQVDLNDLTAFNWDSLIILRPYTSLERLGQKFNLNFLPVSNVGIEHRDDICLIVFFENEAIINQVEYPRGSGDFSNNEARFIKSGKAIFLIKNSNQRTLGGKKFILVELM